MTKRVKNTIAAVAALAALALGGAVFAQAQGDSQSQSQPATVEATSGPDGDTIQSGDQTTPDHPGMAAGSEQGGESPDPSGGEGSAQSGSESPDQSDSESTDQSDGPAGHADPTGDVNNQFQGQQ